MILDIKVMDLDKPNLNGTVFTESAIKNACSKIKKLDIPVVYNSDTSINPYGSINIDDIVGFANLLEEKYPDMSFRVKIGNESFKEFLRNNKGGFGPNYTAVTEFNNDVTVVTNAEINTIGYTMNPASKTSYEIIE